jgi:methyl-accepting chemotaxis protein
LLTLRDVKVNGPRYKVIALGKDLQADILPPPEYILEAYALTMEIPYVEQKEHRERIIAKGQQLKDDFETRLAFWEKNMPDPEMLKLLLEEAAPPARGFSAPRDDTARASCGNVAKSDFLL